MAVDDNPAGGSTAGSTGQPASEQRALTGRYSYRFSGRTMAFDRPWFLCGVGVLTIGADNATLTGNQFSSILPLAGPNAAVQSAEYQVNGSITVDAGGSGTAQMTFTTGSGEPVKGWFNVQMAGDSRNFWMISTSAALATGELAAELVTVEVIWAGA